MKVGYQTQVEKEYQAIEVDGIKASPVMVSVAQKKDRNMDKYIVWHVEGGLGKNVAATALLPTLKQKYKDRKIVMVVSYPEVFLNHPDVHRVYRVGMTAYFYDDFILGKDTIVFRHEPYFETAHILKQKHVVENWANLLGIDYSQQLPKLHMNMVQKNFKFTWDRDKPVMLIQTAGGLFQGQQLSYAWTRDMPIEYANWIAQEYGSKYHIIQVCRDNAPHIPGAEVINMPLTNMELFSLVEAADKLILIDSSLQHAAAAMRKKAVVFWIGTDPNNFGYKMHQNIKAKDPKGGTKLVDAYLFDASFEGVPHECPYTDVNEMFDLEEIKKAIAKAQ